MEVLRSSHKLIEQLRKVCNDEAIDKAIKKVSLKTRWPALHRMTNLSLVVPLYSNLTPAEVDGGGAAGSPFSPNAPTIASWGNLVGEGGGLNLGCASAVPGRILRLGDSVEVMGSLQRPKKVAIIGSDGVKCGPL